MLPLMYVEVRSVSGPSTALCSKDLVLESEWQQLSFL
ncbi:rCG31787 [Rattus norvegicus]|uniref:RCG31787 n=1 Tax=Rattus norvegicus TaxID=10116 RepID=A6JNF1_RAT|nr:rCG31787 [Rattus norvegicus]